MKIENRKLINQLSYLRRLRDKSFLSASKQIRLFFSFLLRIYIYILKPSKRNMSLSIDIPRQTRRERIIFLWLQLSMEIHSSKQGYLFHLRDSICVFLPAKWIRFIKHNNRPSDIRCDGISFNELDNRERS